MLSCRNFYILFLTVVFLGLHAQYKYPTTLKNEVSDTYFGTKVEDPYRWLEDDKSVATENWVKEQNKLSSNYFDKISDKPKIKTRLTELWNYSKQSAPYKKGKYFFCTKNNGLQNQSVLYIQNSVNDTGEILLDPNTLSVDGTISLSGTSISNVCTSLDFGISKAGSDWVEIRFRDVASKKDLSDELKWVKFSGMSWFENGIYYSRYDAPVGSELSQLNQFHKVYYH
jgi:prolyl oligopeptidase